MAKYKIKTATDFKRFSYFLVFFLLILNASIFTILEIYEFEGYIDDRNLFISMCFLISVSLFALFVFAINFCVRVENVFLLTNDQTSISITASEAERREREKIDEKETRKLRTEEFVKKSSLGKNNDNNSIDSDYLKFGES